MKLLSVWDFRGQYFRAVLRNGQFLRTAPRYDGRLKAPRCRNRPSYGKIAKQLYQKANIAVQGFEETKLPDDHFDVVIGNVPFGDFKVNDSRYNAQKFLIHDYFSQRLLIKFVRAVSLRSLPLREQWIRQAPKYASILLREPSCSELSDCLITLSEQTQAQRLRATFYFAEA